MNVSQNRWYILLFPSVWFKNTEPVWILPSQGDGQVEDREHHGAAVISEQVSYDGGRDGGVAGLSDTHQSPGEHKQPVVLHREKKKEKERIKIWSFVIKLRMKRKYFLVKNLFPHQLFVRVEHKL